METYWERGGKTPRQTEPGRGEQPGKEERRVGAEPWRDHTGKGKTSERQRGKQREQRLQRTRKKGTGGKEVGSPKKVW